MAEHVSPLEAVTSALRIENFVDKIDEENKKIRESESKETRELVTALKDLNKRLEKTEKGEKTPKVLSAFLGDKIQSVKQYTTLEGLAKKAAEKSGGGLLSSVFATAGESLENKRLDKERQRSFVASALAGTEVGREMVSERGTAGAAKVAAGVFKQRQELEKKIDTLKQQEKIIKEGGVEGAGLPPEQQAMLDELEKMLKDNQQFFVKKSKSDVETAVEAVDEKSTLEEQPETTEKPITKKELRAKRKEVIEAARAEIHSGLQSMSDEEKEELQNNPEKMGQLEAAIESALKELADISDDQLKELIRIGETLENTSQKAEDRIESEVKSGNLEKKAAEAKEAKEKSNPLDTIMKIGSSLAGGASSILGKVGDVAKIALPALGTVARFAAPVAGIAAAGAGGYMLGNALNDHLFNPAAAEITGDKDATVGTALYAGVDKIAGLFGASDADKLKKADEESLIALARKKIDAGEKISPQMADKLQQIGFSLPADSIGIAKGDTRREALTNTVEKAAEVSGKNSPAMNQTINAPTTVNNSTNNTTINNKPVRNEESSLLTNINRKINF